MRESGPTNTEDPTATVGSTDRYFSLWDVETGNSLGTYDSEQEVWDVISALLEANGSEYADALDLSLEDEAGGWRRVASGAALLERTGQMSRQLAM